MDLSEQGPPTQQEFAAQIDRILHSGTFHSSEASRRLLKFLAQKLAAGEAEHLKEYTVAVEALERPHTYDPRHDSTVRIQMGRLRQKLSDYYQDEGKSELIVIELPKGRFKLTCTHRPADAPPSAMVTGRAAGRAAWMWAGGLVLLLALLWVAYSFGHKSAEASGIATGGFANADMEALWHPFFASGRPWIIAVEDPLFVRFNRMVCRNPDVNEWDEVENSTQFSKVGGLLNANSTPSHYYMPSGDVNAAFWLGRMLGRAENVSLVRISQLSLQQLSGNNVVLIGRQARFDEQFKGSAINPPLTTDATGIVNLHPGPGEPAKFIGTSEGSDYDEGIAYALVSHLPGPLGRGDMQVFSSQATSGYMGAIQWFTDPAMANMIVQKLRRPSGEMPRYYQVVLKVRYKDFVPTETTWVLSRDLE